MGEPVGHGADAQSRGLLRQPPMGRGRGHAEPASGLPDRQTPDGGQDTLRDVFLWPAEALPLPSGSGQPRRDTLGDSGPLQLRQSRQHVELQSSGWRRAVDPLAEGHERDAEGLYLVQEHHQVSETAPEAVRRWYAWMLLDRDASGDRDKARTLLGEATEMYQTIGMPKHLEMVEKMSAAL